MSVSRLTGATTLVCLPLLVSGGNFIFSPWRGAVLLTPVAKYPICSPIFLRLYQIHSFVPCIGEEEASSLLSSSPLSSSFSTLLPHCSTSFPHISSSASFTSSPSLSPLPLSLLSPLLSHFHSSLIFARIWLALTGYRIHLSVVRPPYFLFSYNLIIIKSYHILRLFILFLIANSN